MERCGRRASTQGPGCPHAGPGVPSRCGEKGKGRAHRNTHERKAPSHPSRRKSAICKGQTESQGRGEAARTPPLHLSITETPWENSRCGVRGPWHDHVVMSPSSAAVVPLQGSESVGILRELQQQPAAGREDPEAPQLGALPLGNQAGWLFIHSFSVALPSNLPHAICLLGPRHIRW